MVLEVGAFLMPLHNAKALKLRIDN